MLSDRSFCGDGSVLSVLSSRPARGHWASGLAIQELGFSLAHVAYGYLLCIRQCSVITAHLNACTTPREARLVSDVNLIGGLAFVLPLKPQLWLGRILKAGCKSGRRCCLPVPRVHGWLYSTRYTAAVWAPVRCGAMCRAQVTFFSIQQCCVCSWKSKD